MLKELLEKKASLYAQIRKMSDTINSENRDFHSEEKAAWDKVNADYDANQSRLEICHRVDKLSKDLADRRPEATIQKPDGLLTDREQTAAHAIAGWFAGAEATDKQIEAMQAIGMKSSRKLDIKIGGTADFRARREQFMATPPSQRRALGLAPQSASLLTSSTSAAGYLIAPGSLANALEIATLAFGGPLQLAEVIRTDHGEAFSWPSANDTGNKGELLAEVGSIGSSVNPSIGRTTMNAYKFSSKLIRYSSEMAEDSAFNLMVLLGDMLGERIGRILCDYLTTGTGSSEPQGVTVGAHAGVTAAAVAAITADEIIDLFHSLDPSYRANASFMASDATYKLFRKLKASGSGDYVWRSGGIDGNLSNGFSDTLLGKPAHTNQSMPAATAALVPLLFGDFSKLKVRQVNELRVRRLTEAYATTDEEGMIAFQRFDAKVLNAGTNPIKKLTMAAS